MDPYKLKHISGSSSGRRYFSRSSSSNRGPGERKQEQSTAHYLPSHVRQVTPANFQIAMHFLLLLKPFVAENFRDV
jgi:hypothetical protein